MPGAEDLGLGDARPIHRPVIVPVPDDSVWRDVHRLMRHIAVANGVVVVTRPPVNGLPLCGPATRTCAPRCARSSATRGRRRGVITNTEVMPTADAPLPAAA